jgi:predicted nucleotidyltransferase
MRLEPDQAYFIKQTAENLFGKESKVYLFGSRIDNDKKGGDIDLYIETFAKEGLFNKKIKMLKALYKKLGRQKIDIVLNNFKADLYIYKVAQNEGILL